MDAFDDENFSDEFVEADGVDLSIWGQLLDYALTTKGLSVLAGARLCSCAKYLSVDH